MRTSYRTFFATSALIVGLACIATPSMATDNKGGFNDEYLGIGAMIGPTTKMTTDSIFFGDIGDMLLKADAKQMIIGNYDLDVQTDLLDLAGALPEDTQINAEHGRYVDKADKLEI